MWFYGAKVVHISNGKQPKTAMLCGAYVGGVEPLLCATSLLVVTTLNSERTFKHCFSLSSSIIYLPIGAIFKSTSWVYSFVLGLLL